MEKLVKKLEKSDNPYSFTDKLSIKQLEDIIDYTNKKYRIGETVISDALWDMMVDFLRLKIHYCDDYHSRWGHQMALQNKRPTACRKVRGRNNI